MRSTAADIHDLLSHFEISDEIFDCCSALPIKLAQVVAWIMQSRHDVFLFSGVLEDEHLATAAAQVQDPLPLESVDRFEPVGVVVAEEYLPVLWRGVQL